MYFQILSHAGLRIVAGGKELLCDPWLLGSAYWRSWWNYPPVPAELITSLRPDYIYLTHLHWDHFHAVSLRRFSPDIQILVPYDRYGRIMRDLGHIGMRNVRELGHGERVELGPGFALTSYHFGPFITDSAPLIEAEGVTLWNANDAKFAGPPLKQILKRHPQIDFCLRSHSSANPRACYHEIGPGKTKPVLEDNERYSRTFSLFMAAVKPRFAIPFASNNCLLHDDVFHLNSLVQTPRIVADHFDRFADERRLSTKLRIMNPGDIWDSEQGFAVQENDWFEDRQGKLDEYRLRVAGTLERQARKEARTSVSLRTLERYFSKLARDIPSAFTLKMRGREVLLIAKSGTTRSGFAVDLHGGKVRDVQPATFGEFDMRIEFPSVVLRQALAMNMFGHAGISKRVNYYATDAAMPKLKWFVALLELAESEIFPLRSNINWRTFRALRPRWREGLLYARVLVDLARGNELLEVEERYLADQADIAGRGLPQGSTVSVNGGQYLS